MVRILLELNNLIVKWPSNSNSGSVGGKAKEGKEEGKEEDDIEEEQDDIEEAQDDIDIEEEQDDIFIENGGVNFQHSAGSPVGPQCSSWPSSLDKVFLLNNNYKLIFIKHQREKQFQIENSIIKSEF